MSLTTFFYLKVKSKSLQFISILHENPKETQIPNPTMSIHSYWKQFFYHYTGPHNRHQNEIYVKLFSIESVIQFSLKIKIVTYCNETQREKKLNEITKTSESRLKLLHIITHYYLNNFFFHFSALNKATNCAIIRVLVKSLRHIVYTSTHFMWQQFSRY